MRILSPIYRTLLAVFLLSGLLVSASRGAGMPATGYAEAQWQQDGDKHAVIAEGRDAQDALLHTQRQLPFGHAAGGSLHAPGSKSCFLLPGGIPLLIAACSKARLRRRLFLLLEHYVFPQRSSLFPKHGFW